jgi:hypothetical protein
MDFLSISPYPNDRSITLDRLSSWSLFGLLAMADGKLIKEFLRESFY